MHGRNRAEYKSRLLDPTASAALAKKAESYHSLSRKLLLLRAGQQRRQRGGGAELEVDDEAPAIDASIPLSLTGKILSANPDPGHLWNYRRELLLLLPRRGEGGFNVRDELDLTASCLRKNPKAYGAWFHRKWSVRRFCHLAAAAAANDADAGGKKNGDEEKRGDGEDAVGAVLSSELDLCGEFLSLDERNFHCWNYRRFVVSALAFRRLRGMCGGAPRENGGAVAVECDGSWSWAADPAPSSDRGCASEMIMGPQLAPPPAPDADAGGEELASGGGTNDASPAVAESPASAAVSEHLLRTEWDFTTSKISHNFSNCSSFHYRSKLLPFVLRWRLAEAESSSSGHASAGDGGADGGDGDDDDGYYYGAVLYLAREELETIHQALYTEPDDQTPWWYHRHVLLTFASPTTRTRTRRGGEEDGGGDVLNSNRVEMYADLLREEEDVARELIEAEGGRCKWGLLALHDMLAMRMGLLPVGEEEAEGMRDEARGCLARLGEIDPDRAGRYRSMMAATAGTVGTRR